MTQMRAFRRFVSRHKQPFVSSHEAVKSSTLERWLAGYTPDVCVLTVPPQKRHRPKKSWQKRLDGHQLPLVEEDLRRLFALRMRVSRRAKVEANLSGLFNERKIPHYVDPEVDLRNLFAVKKPQLEKPVA